MTSICIEGNIGAGKSTLARTLSEHLDWRWLAEPVDDNICLDAFYADQKRWAFATQMYFMNVRFRMHMHAAYSDKPVILDRALIGDRVFCKLHLKYGNLNQLEWQIYETSFTTMNAVRAPSLLVYLEVDPEVSFARLQRRNRSNESAVPLQYLKDLDNEYEALVRDIESGDHHWSRGIKVLRVPWNDDVDDIRNSVSYQHVVEEVRRYVGRA